MEIVVHLQSCALVGTDLRDAPPDERKVATDLWIDVESQELSEKGSNRLNGAW